MTTNTEQATAEKVIAKTTGIGVIAGIIMSIYKIEKDFYINIQPLRELAGLNDRWLEFKSSMLKDVNVQLYGSRLVDEAEDPFTLIERTPLSVDDNLYIRLDRVTLFILKIDPQTLLDQGREETAAKLIKMQKSMGAALHDFTSETHTHCSGHSSEKFNELKALIDILKELSPGRSSRKAFFGMDRGSAFPFPLNI